MTSPKWIKELSRFCKVKNSFLFSVNIYDSFYYENSFLSLDKYLEKYLIEKEEYTTILKYEPLFGFGKNETLKSAYELIEEKVDESGVCVIFNFTSRLKDIASRDIEEFFYKIFRLSQKQTPKMLNSIPKYNLFLFLIEKENDIPAWYLLENIYLKSIIIPKPDELERKIIADNILKLFGDFENLDNHKKDEIKKIFITQTSNMNTKDIISIITLALRENLKATQISEAIRRYKVGIVENPWSKIDKDRLKNSKEFISKRVIGQEEAVDKAVDIIKRAFFNLSGVQFSRYSNRPKGVLFLAGPTGVGKTELAKSIAELIFGSEDNYIRFDMSEFAQEHTTQRLIGSPPGYVGYDVGGELVNKIKEKPFSVVLFDEIEKAHPRILDIFLQILDEGRLTSARGESVYFSESIIIFTTNLGVYKDNKLNVSIEDNFDTIQQKVTSHIEEYFKFQINRPEILNRIGKNIVVFDFIREENAKNIFDKMMNNIIIKLSDEYKINLTIQKEVYEKIKQHSIQNLTMGGRGIGNEIEEKFINPLAGLLFELMPKENEKVIIDNLKEDKWQLSGYISH